MKLYFSLLSLSLSILLCHTSTVLGDELTSAVIAESPANQHKNAGPISVSGVYPHLAYWNDHGECGTGAVVPWAGKLWVITYGPHYPEGSTDKLYEIDELLNISIFEGSVGGTPANRLIHRETKQLVIGPYVINDQGTVRVIPQSKMYGRLTGTARHLFEPEKKVYYSTMEEGIYSVDLESLKVTEHFKDDQLTAYISSEKARASSAPASGLPGYHGKGLYSGQGRLIYANNGENSNAARKRPDVPSGCLAEWDGKSKKWKVIRRNQFTDVRGPGGLYGNSNPETDPVWAIGWDHRSLILMLLDNDEWFTYRLPKAAHTYDGAHGWNTEWPRINDLGGENLVMNMHGMFWDFPRTFCRANSKGIAPRSTYLKVIGDYTMWQGHLVIGCDDSAKTEFLNTRRAKGHLAGPGQSHSNLWFCEPDILDQLGPALGRGSVWMNESVKANTVSDPYLFDNFVRRSLLLTHDSSDEVTFTLEIDQEGNNQWEDFAQIEVPAGKATRHSFASDDAGVWIRIRSDKDLNKASAQFHYSNPDKRSKVANSIFDGISKPGEISLSGGTVRVRGGGIKTLGFCAQSTNGNMTSKPAFYELDAQLNLQRSHSEDGLSFMLEKCRIPKDIIEADDASLIYTDDDGNRWRLPRGRENCESLSPLGAERLSREVVTERDLFNCGGLFYELPARNAGGIAKIRPVSTHNRQIIDYCSYRGLAVISGISADAPESEHIIKSDDGKVALWVGVIDDLWKFGKPTGFGGPWKETSVEPDSPSDPYLLTGFDKKTLTVANDGNSSASITVQVDIDGTGTWVNYKTFDLAAVESITENLASDFAAYWLRAVSNTKTIATVQLQYE